MVDIDDFQIIKKSFHIHFKFHFEIEQNRVSQICLFICTHFTGFVWQEENMVFNDRENPHVFKLCYLTAEVVIYIFLSTSKTKKLKH